VVTVASPSNVARVLVYIGLGLALGVGIAVAEGGTAAAEYYAAYVLEVSLSVDNIFVFIIIFSELHIPAEYQRRVLRFGVLGALVFRAVLIGVGISLIERFHWAIYPFAGLILFAAWRILFAEEPQRRVVKEACDVCATWIARVVRVTPVVQGEQFWIREGARRVATPLFVALAVIETTDIVFALDSIPAVLAVSRNPFVVYSSNIMAMLVLRSMYFVLTDVLQRVRYLRAGLALVLLFTAVKMLVADWLRIGPGVSVAVIALVILGTVAASLWRPPALSA
jgi:tellurite resistance protein TerC